MDSVHPTQATKITSGWIRKGVEKMIATVAGRSRINLTGAIDLESMSIFTQEYETINGESTIDFLKYLDKSTDDEGKIVSFLKSKVNYKTPLAKFRIPSNVMIPI